MSERQLDIFAAERSREAGMLMTEAAADDADPGWSDRAYFFLQRYLQFHPYDFMAEQAREWAYKNGLETTKHPRAWGAVIRRAAKDGVIIFRGYARTSNPLAHRTPASLWSANVRD